MKRVMSNADWSKMKSTRLPSKRAMTSLGRMSPSSHSTLDRKVDPMVPIFSRDTRNLEFE